MKYIFIVLLLSSCSANWHLQQSKKHKLIAIAKGAKIFEDTIKSNISVTNKVKSDSGSIKVNPIIDDKTFDFSMNENDSLTLALDSIRKGISKGLILDKEKALVSLKAANDEIKALRNRIRNGFSKDSTYVYKVDSVSTIFVTIKKGLLSKIDFKRLETSVTEVHKLPVALNENITTDNLSFFKKLIIALSLLLIGIIIGYVLGRFVK